MRLIAKVIKISRAKFHCNRLTTVQDIQYYASLVFLAHSVVIITQFFTTLPQRMRKLVNLCAGG